MTTNNIYTDCGRNRDREVAPTVKIGTMRELNRFGNRRECEVGKLVEGFG